MLASLHEPEIRSSNSCLPQPTLFMSLKQRTFHRSRVSASSLYVHQALSRLVMKVGTNPAQLDALILPP